MVNGMIDSLLSSFVIVFLMMVFLFRSIKYGILAMLPLTLTISMIYGLIGWIGKDYDMPIAVLSALTLGLSIDFAIHFLQRARELEKQLGNLSLALAEMFQEPSRAISRNAIVIAIGFTPLLLSPLMPYITVGFFLASIMALSALVTLVLLPALMTLFSGKKA
jgi:predicted RND superfamily exporter protein